MAAMTTKISIPEARAVLAKATPGEFLVGGYLGGAGEVYQAEHGSRTRTIANVMTFRGVDDATAIAYAHNNLPAILDWVESAAIFLDAFLAVKPEGYTKARIENLLGRVEQ